MVERQKQQKRFVCGADGSTEEARIAVKEKQLHCRSGTPVEVQRERCDERVQRLPDGRTMVTETIVMQKVTYLS